MAAQSKDSYLRSLQCTTRFEEIARNEHGATRIGGVDECARGNWAAETCAGCVILPDSLPPELDGKLRDSKLISPKKRAALAELIKQHAVAWNVASVSAEVIDEVGIHNAGVMAMEFAVHGLSVVPDFLLIDSVKIDIDIPQLSINQGDALSVSIAAASILAKTHHTALMEEYDRQFPQYGFIRHKGYGTKEHIAAIRKYGLTPLHRRSFQPIKNFVQSERTTAGSTTLNSTERPPEQETVWQQPNNHFSPREDRLPNLHHEVREPPRRARPCA